MATGFEMRCHINYLQFLIIMDLSIYLCIKKNLAAEVEGTITEPTQTEDFLRGGIVFYKKDDRIVGVLTWNLPGKSRVPLARKVNYNYES